MSRISGCLVWMAITFPCSDEHTASLQFRWLALPRLHGLFVGEVLVFLLFKGKLIKHANHRMRQEAVRRAGSSTQSFSRYPKGKPRAIAGDYAYFGRLLQERAGVESVREERRRRSGKAAGRKSPSAG